MEKEFDFKVKCEVIEKRNDLSKEVKKALIKVIKREFYGITNLNIKIQSQIGNAVLMLITDMDSMRHGYALALEKDEHNYNLTLDIKKLA